MHDSITGVTIKPTGDMVLVKVEQSAATSANGILLPPPKVRSPKKGVVVGFGPGRHMEGVGRIPVDLEVGEVVYFPHTVGVDLRGGDDYYLMVSESKILMAVGPEAEGGGT